MNKDDDVTLIPVAIASQAAAGNVATIPATQATAGDGRVSIDLGYPPECAISVAAGGKYPEMQDANGVYRLLSSAIRSNQSWGILPFDADFAAGIGGYPAGAMVSGSTSGTFWISTADNNTTTPGASGATWQSLFAGYITQAQSDARYLMLSSTALQTVTGPVTFGGTTLVPAVTDWTKRQAVGAADADGRYVRSPANPSTDAKITVLSRNKSSGGIFAAADDGSNTQLQPAGDYATNTALNTEITNRTNADTNLNNAKVNRAGDTMSDNLNIRAYKTFPGGNFGGQVLSIISGQSGGSSSGDYSFGLWMQQVSGQYTSGILSVNGFQGRKDWRFNEDGNIISPLGTVALTSQIPTDIYTLTNMQSDFSTSDNRVINLPYGHRIQVFTATVSGSSQTVTFPTAFSSTNGMVVLATCSLQPGYTNRAGLVQVNSWTASSANVTTFFLDAPNLEFATAGLPCYFVAIGPK